MFSIFGPLGILKGAHTHTQQKKRRKRAQIRKRGRVQKPMGCEVRPAPYSSLSGPSGPECPEECPRECPRKRGRPRKCPAGCPWGPSGHRLRSVQKVSRECPPSVQKVSRTLWGHSRDTPEPKVRRPQGHPVRHSLGQPPFSGTLSGTLPGTLWTRRARKTPVEGRALRNLWVIKCPEGPKIEKINSRSIAWKNHSHTNEKSFLLEISILGLKISFSIENFNPKPCFSVAREGSDWKKPSSIENFIPRLKSWIFQSCISRLIFFNLWTLCVDFLQFFVHSASPLSIFLFCAESREGIWGVEKSN